jgi:TetR/AcrR family transcriptional repressor of nem operon
MGNREKLLEAAARIFAERGYQGTSVDDILGPSRVSPSNFYYHFKSKEDLALEVLESYFEASRRELAPLFMNRALGPSAKLEQMRRLFVQKMSQKCCCGGCPLGNLAQELSDSHPGFRRRLAAFFEECIEGIAGVVAAGVKTGEFRRGVDPRWAAHLLFGSIEGLILLSKTFKDVGSLDRGFRQALELLKNEK